MNIKTKSRDPKSTDFSKKELVININEGSLFYKSNKGVHKINPTTGIVSTVIGADGAPGDKGDKGDAGENAVTLDISSNTNIFTFDNSGDDTPTPSACTITVIQNNQNNNLLEASLFLLTTNATLSNYAYTNSGTQGSGVATWTLTPAISGEMGHGVYPITVAVSNDGITKSITLHKVAGGDAGITLPGTPGDSYFNDIDNATTATTATNNITFGGNIGIGLDAVTTPTEKLELDGNFLLNTGDIRSSGDLNLLTDDTIPHAEDKCYVNIKSTTAATDINGDLNLVQNHTLTGDSISGEIGAYNGYPQYVTGTDPYFWPNYWCFDDQGNAIGTFVAIGGGTNNVTDQANCEATPGNVWQDNNWQAVTIMTYADDFSQGYFGASGMGNFSCEGDASVGKFLTVGWNTVGGSGLSTSATLPQQIPLGSIAAVGDIYAGTSLLTSDIKLKKNITSIKDSLNKILSLEGKTYEWKDKTKPGKQYGLIAQDVEKIIPELVNQGETKYLNYTGIIPVLIEAIKDQQKQIDELKSKIK
tara:strand:+ start:1225 stop:2817 length:1593 start_codon:yes stop_codon:yes gene_type:complete